VRYGNVLGDASTVLESKSVALVAAALSRQGLPLCRRRTD